MLLQILIGLLISLVAARNFKSMEVAAALDIPKTKSA